MASTDNGEIRATSYVGFDTITQQIEHKLLKRGFQFNVIVVGMYRVFSLKLSSCREACSINTCLLLNGLQDKLVLESRLSSTPFSRRT